MASTAISTPSADSPSTELIDPGRASAARCIASARLATSSSPASNDRAPAATRAENSPRECPATYSGRGTPAASSARRAATETQKIAGWAM